MEHVFTLVLAAWSGLLTVFLSVIGYIMNEKFNKIKELEDKLHARYRAVSKKIQSFGLDIGKTVPFFLVDQLEIEEKKGFRNLKKYLGRKP